MEVGRERASLERFEKEVFESIKYFTARGLLALGDRIREEKFQSGGRRGSRSPALFDFWAFANRSFYAIECKRTKSKRFSLSRLKPHQLANLQLSVAHGGYGWLALNFRNRKYNRTFILDTSDLDRITSKTITVDACAKYGREIDRFVARLTEKGQAVYEEKGTIVSTYARYGWDLWGFEKLHNFEFELGKPGGKK